MEKIRRNCVVCGDEIKIKVDKKGHYDKGYYFGVMKIPVKGTGEHKQVGITKILGEPAPVVEWTGKEKEFEYWDCNLCYDAAMREDWLEKRIEKYYGERCPDFEPSCALCDAWSLYDKIVKDNSLRGKFEQSYDKQADAAYIFIKPKLEGRRAGEAARQLELSDHIILDFDKKRNLLGIEVLDASRNMPKVFANQQQQKGK